MKIFVCVKQVPDTETKVKVGANNQIDSTGVKWMVNSYDEYAIEEAIKLKDKLKDKFPSIQTWAITLGPKSRATEALRTALAMGIDEAICIDAPSDLDSLLTAKALAVALKKESEIGIILTGKTAIDDNASAVGPMLADLLQFPHASVVSKLDVEINDALISNPASALVLTAQRDSDGGTKEIIELKTPALISANKGLNLPRYANLPGIMKAKKKIIKELSYEALSTEFSTDSISKVKIIGLELPAEKPAVKFLSGNSSSQSSQLVQLLRDEAKVL